MNNPNNSREKLYTRLKDDGYDLVDFDTFSKKLDEESSRKSLYDQMTSAGYDLGGYDEYTRKIVGSPFKQNNSVAPTPSEKPEEEKAMISAPSASTDEEYITGFGQGVKQGTQQLAAGVKYAGGEALDLVTKTAKDNASALAALDKMQAEGKDVAQETKIDAKSVLLPLIGHSAPAIDMVARVFGKKNPIAKANAEVANDKIIRKALEETDGDVEAARALLEQRANEQTTADEWRDEAAQVMNEAKPTKGAGAWVGNMIPQMVGTAAGLGLSAITKSPLPAQILGLGQMGALTASTAGASMKEARDAGATNGEVWATGLADAAIEFATEAIPFKGYLSPLVKQMKSKTGKAIADVIVDKKSPARKELQNLLDKANAQLGGKLFTTENAAKYLDDVLKEGASEFTAEALQAITPMLYAEPENYPTLWEVFSNGIEGLKGGIFMGSVLGGVSNAATNKAQRDRRKEQGFVNVAEVKVSEDSDETTIAEVIDYDDHADRASILINGEIMPLENASKNVVNQEVFTFEEFDRGQVDMEHAESYDRGRNLATPQEKNDALNDLEAQEANIRQRYSLDPDADVYEFMGGDPIAYAMNETDTELRSEILDLVNAKAVYDGMTDGINERIATTIEESDRLIDSHVNKDDNLIHAAILKGVDDNSDRKVYIISGAFARNEDGTIDTTDLAEGASMIVMDATSGKREFIDPRNLKDIAEGINPAVAKQRAAETITNEIATKEEAEIAGTLAFVPNDIYTIADENGVEHTATIVADTQDGNVQVIIDNAQEPMLMPKEKVQQMADAYNIGRANAKIAEKKAQSTVAQSSSEVKPTIPMDEQGKPIYEQAPVEATWAELLSLNDGNAEEAIDTAKIMRDNAKKALEKANKAASAKGDTVEAIQQAKAERKALIDAAQAKYDYWDNVANYQASQPQEVAEPTTAEEQTPIVENASFDENINEVEQVYNEESNERSTEDSDVPASVPAEDGIADGDQASVEMVQGAGTDNTLGDRGSIEAGQGSNESNVGEGVADVPSADVFRAEEVDVTTPQLSAKEEMRRKPLRARAKMWEAKVGVPVHLIETFEEVPTEDARKAILDGKVVTAWVTDGEVYLYMPYLRNRTEVDKTYIHEVVAHVGMKRLLGKEGYRQFCMRVYNEVMTEADREFYDAYPNVKNHAQAADEYIAHLSEDTDMESSIWQKVVRIFRDALRVLGIETALTNKDIQNMLRDSYKNLTNEENVADIDEESGQAMFSIRTYEEGGKKKLLSFLKNRVKDGAITQAESEDILKEMDQMYETAIKYKDKYAPFGAWSDAKVVENKDGKPAFSVIKKNDEYVMNLDFSTSCKKRRTLDAVYDSLLKRGLLEKLSLDGEQIVDINNIIRSYGFETACALCFVDAKRYRIGDIADKFSAFWNELVDMSDAKLKRVIKAEEKDSVRKKAAQHLISHPEDRIKVGRNNFISVEAFEDMELNRPAILSFYRQAQGSSIAKIPYRDVQYNSDIEGKKWNAEDAYAVGGVRVQSFSDYIPRLFFDYMQMFAALSARKMPVHAYTKEPIFAKQFGLTGAKINLSLVPDVVEGGVAAGLDADGNYAWKKGETFPYDEAIALQNAEGYRENCGTIAVGVSDAHIEKMLDDPNIRMVIPYHKSGINPLVAAKNKIDAFEDYTSVQGTRDAKGTKLTKEAIKKYNMPNFNALMHEGMDARQAAQAYLDWCDENGFLPKFDKFRNHPNYYKLLEDFTTIVPDANGVETIYPQGAVSMTFPTEEDAFGSIESLIREGLEEDAILEGRRDENVERIVDTIEKELVNFRFIGEVGASNLDKAEEATTRLDNLAIAREMEVEGTSARSIKMATGWERGADGKWRYEVNDNITAKHIRSMKGAGAKKILEARSKRMSDLDKFMYIVRVVGADRLYDDKKILATSWPEAQKQNWLDAYELYKDNREGAIEDIRKANAEYKKLQNLGKGEFILYEVLGNDHDLFKEYPQLRNVNVVLKPYKGGGNRGNYNRLTNTITIIDYRGIMENDKGEGSADTLVHEIQHIIQSIEGFARGGNTMMDDPQKVKAKETEVAYQNEMFEDAVKERNDLSKQMRLLNQEMMSWWDNNPDATWEDALADEKMFNLNKQYSDVEKQMEEVSKRVELYESALESAEGIDTSLGLEGYKRLAGEVEARNVERRRNMSLGERRNSPAWMTEDVARKDQIFIEDALGEANAQFRISNYDRQFADLQSEYDALDKNDEKALNEWREKKKGVTLSYMKATADDLNYPIKDFRVIASEEDMRNFYEEVVKFFNEEMDYKKFAQMIMKPAAFYLKDMEIIGCHTDQFPNVERKAYVALFHEQTHCVNGRLFSDEQLANIWDEAVQNAKKEKTERIARNYGDNPSNNGDEYLAYTAQRYAHHNIREDFESYIKGEDGVSLDTFMRSANKSLPLRNQALIEILKYYRNGYNKRRHSRNVEESHNGLRSGNGENQRDIRAERGGIRGGVLDSLLNDVAQRGLREMVGEDAYNAFLMRAVRDLDESTRRAIMENGMRNGLNFHDAAEEYLASLAEQDNVDEAYLSKVNALVKGMLQNAGIEVGDISNNELRYMLWRSHLQYDGIFSLAEDVVMRSRLGVGNYTQEADTSFRVAPSTPSTTIVNGEAKGVRESFDDMVKRASYQMKEAGYDRYQSIKEFMRMASKAHGMNLKNDDVKEIVSYENPYIALLNKSSINEKEVKAWEKKYYIPIIDAIQRIYKDGKGKIAQLQQHFGSESMDDILNNYLQGKHGLERNRDMAVRKSLDNMAKATVITKQEAEDMLETVNADLRNDVITPTQADARRQQINNMLTTKKYDEKMVKHQTERWDEIKDEIRKNDKLTWEQKQRALDKAAITEFGVDLAERDYSGLGEVFPNKGGKLQESIEAAYKAVVAFEEAFDTADLWKAIKAANDATLEKAFMSSIINRETYNNIRNMYDYYIPLRGFEADTTEDVYGYLNNEPKAFSMPVKRANGRASKAEFAIPHILQMAHSAILQGNNNLAKLTMANFAQHYPSDLVKQSNMWIEYDETSKTWVAKYPDIPKDASVEDVSRIVDDFNANMEELAKDNPKKYRKVKGKMDVPYIVPKDKVHYHQIPYKRNGVDYILTVSGSPRLAFVMNGEIDKAPSVMGEVGEKVEGITRFLSGMYTQYNPDFMVSNFFRDASFVLSTVPVREDAKYAANYYKNYFLNNPLVMTRLFNKYEAGTLNRDNYIEAAFEDFLKHGGETGYAILRDVEETKKKVKKDIHYGLWNKAKALIDRLGIVGRGVESSARFAAYLTSREAGRSIARSVYDAKEVSVNFNRKGAGAVFNNLADQNFWGKMVGNTAGVFKITHAFWNAGIQGLAGVSKLIKYNPIKGGMVWTSSALMLGAIVASLYDDDDEYYNLTETVRRQNIMIRMGDDYVSIPLAIELRALYGIGEMMVSLSRGKEDLTQKDVAYKIAEQILQAFPINVLEGNGGFDALMPTAYAMVQELMVNEDWQGIPIYREDKYAGEEYKPEWRMVNNYTDERLVAASKFLSKAAGGDYGKRGRFEIPILGNVAEINPAVVQHIMEGMFGGPVTFANKVLAQYDVLVGDKEFEWRNVPFLNRLVKDGGGKAQERMLNREYRNNEERYEQMHSQEVDYQKFIKDASNSEEERAEYQRKLDELRASEEYKMLNRFHQQSLEIDKMYKEYKDQGILDEQMPTILERKEIANAPLR